MNAVRPLALVIGLGAGAAAACGPAPEGRRDLTPGRLEREARVRALYDVSVAHLERREFEPSEAVLRSILDLDPDHPLPRLGLVLIAQRRGALAAAEEGLRGQAAAPGPGPLYGVGTLRFLQGRMPEATDHLERALAGYRAIGHAAGEAAALTGIGNVRFRDADWDGAGDAYRAAAAIAERLGDTRSAADLQSNLGNVLQARGDDEGALAAYRRALDIRETLGDRKGIAGARHNLGLVLRRRGDAAGARAAFEEALRVHADLGDDAGAIRNLNALGLLHLDAGDQAAALDVFETALGRAATAGDGRAEAATLTNLATADLRAGRTEEALARQRRALDLRRRLRDLPGTAASLNNLAAVHELLGERREALRLYAEGLDLARSVGDRRGEAALLLNLGRLRRAIDRRAGLADLEQARDRFRGLGDASGEAAAEEEIGRALTDAEDAAGAARALETALRLRRAAGDRAGEALALDARGLLRLRRGDTGGALQDLRRALELARLAGDRRAEAAVLNHTGNLHFARGDLAPALRLQEEALDLRRSLGDRDSEALQLVNIGALHQAFGDPGAAARYLRDALRLMERLPDRAGEALARANLGVILEERGDFQGALREFRRSVRLREALGDRRGAALSRHGEASALLGLGRTGAARAALERTLREAGATDPGVRALLLAGLGEAALREGRPEEAGRRYAEALAVARPAGLKEEITRAETGLGDCLAAAGRWRPAIEAYDRAIATLESIRGTLPSADFKSRYLARAAGLYERPVALLWRHARRDPAADAAGRAFAYAERARARALLDLLAESRADLRGDLDPALRRREAETAARLADAVRRLREAADAGVRAAARADADAAEEEARRVEIAIRDAAPGYARIAYPEPGGAAAARAVLGPGEILLEYLLGDDASWLWVVTPSGIAWHALPPRARLEAEIRRFLDAIRSPAGSLGPSVDGTAGAEALGRLLLPAGAAPAGARLLIVPDGALHHLPFETLVPPGAGAAPSRLVEVCEIAYAPSASTLGALRRLPPVAARDLLALGDPAAPPAALGPWDLAPLPYAREEVERIGALFRPGDRRLLVGGEASEGALKTAAGRAGGMLHLAAHGWIDEEAPARSAILLASSPGEDGLLQMNEIYALRLPVRLAVLSACRSALGPLVRGEGMVGLTQAFLFAGTRAVVVSLWNVNDRAASGLMEHFYRELASGAPPRAALRLAKLRLLRSERETDRHPSIWAPFVLIGDPDAGAAVAPAAAAGRAPD